MHTNNLDMEPNPDINLHQLHQYLHIINSLIHMFIPHHIKHLVIRCIHLPPLPISNLQHPSTKCLAHPTLTHNHLSYPELTKCFKAEPL